MINSILWAITLTYNMGAIFFLRRTFTHLRGILKAMHKDVTQLKLDTHKAVNRAGDNSTNIMANHLECKDSLKEIDKQLGHIDTRISRNDNWIEEQPQIGLKQTIKDIQEKLECLDVDLEVCNENMRERDEAFAQNFAEVYAYIRKNKNPLLDEAMETLPIQRGRSKKKSKE